MEIVKTIEEVKYNAPYFWNPSINPLAKVSTCLPDCTTLVIGSIKASGMPNICSVYGNANEYHKHLINGWVAVPYKEYRANIKIGDVIEWEKGNHVAIVSNIVGGVPYISGSFYTGINGKAYWEGKYDTREGLTSLKQVNDFMIANYPYRYFHYVSIDEESKWCGGEPDYVLVSPMSITPVDKDASKNQIYVGVNGLRVRTEPSTNGQIRGVASIGYYNIDEVVKGGAFDDGDTWYRIGELYVAAVNGVQYYSKDNTIPIDEIVRLMKQMQEAYLKVTKENEELKQKLISIERIIESWKIYWLL